MSSENPVRTRVDHAEEIEPLRGGGRSGQSPIPSQQELPHPLRGTPPPTDLNEASHDIPYHVVEEGIRREEDGDQPAACPELGREEMTDRILLNPCRGAECGKVLLSAEGDESARHGKEVEGPREPPGSPLPEDRGDGPVQDHIGVALRQGRAAGVKVQRDLIGGQDADVGRQSLIQSPLDGSWGKVSLGREVGHLAQRVDPGIRPARPDQGGAQSEEIVKGSAKSPLNRRAIWLDLPSVVGLAGVFDDESDLPHQCGPN